MGTEVDKGSNSHLAKDDTDPEKFGAGLYSV